MRRSLTLFPAAVLLGVPLLLGSASIARSDTARATESSATPRRLEHLKTKLGLSDDQVATVRAAFESNRAARNDLRGQLKTATADLRATALDGGDPTTIQQKTDAVTAIYGKMLALRSDELKKIGAALSPEQRAAFSKMREHGRHGHHGHWGRGKQAAEPEAEG